MYTTALCVCIHSPHLQRNDPNARVVIKVSSFYWLAANNFDWPASIYNVVVLLVGVLLLFVSRILTCHIQHASNMARRALQIKIKMFHSEIKKERKNLMMMKSAEAFRSIELSRRPFFFIIYWLSSFYRLFFFLRFWFQCCHLEMLHTSRISWR